MTNEVEDWLKALHEGNLTLEEVAQLFRDRKWPGRRRQEAATYLELAARELEDPDPYIPGSYDDVAAAYHRGQLTDVQYSVLTEAMAASKRAEDAAEEP